MSTDPDHRPSAAIPVDPPFEHEDLPALGGHIGAEPEDFQVDEIPLYPASGEGDHWYVRLRKRLRTTGELVEAVSRAAVVRDRSVGHAGMKDKHAVTTQWLSVPVSEAPPPPTWRLPDGVELLESTRHNNKLRVGHLAGNRFRIRVAEVEAEAERRAAALCERLRERGMGNYFGSQRFGLGNRNLDQALGLLRRGRLDKRGGKRAKFFASVVQSEVFNRYLRARSREGLEELMSGDVVRLEGSRSVFCVEDPASEQSRLERRDIHLTGPMIGPKMRAAAERPAQLEREAMESLGLDEELLPALGRLAPGTRRDLVLQPGELSCEVEEPGALVLQFSLPAGGYAGLVVRVFTRGGPWLEPVAKGGD